MDKQTPSFRERLREILDNLELDDDGACGDPECCGLPSYHISHSSKDKALTEILSLVEAERTTAYQAGVEKSSEIASEYTMNKKVGEYIMWKAQAILNEIGEGDATRKHDGGL